MWYFLPTLSLAAFVALSENGSTQRAPSSSPTADAASVSTDQKSFTRLLSANTSAFAEPTELVVRDHAALAQAWRTIHGGAVDNPPPKVDLAHRMVVILALGERRTGGYRILFSGMTRGRKGAVVRYTVTSPGPECMTTQMMSSPVDAVSVPRMDGAVRFERKDVVDHC